MCISKLFCIVQNMTQITTKSRPPRIKVVTMATTALGFIDFYFRFWSLPLTVIFLSFHLCRLVVQRPLLPSKSLILNAPVSQILPRGAVVSTQLLLIFLHSIFSGRTA